MGRSLPLDERLRAEIAAGVFAPAERLRIGDLQARFGAGLSATREALARLAGEGWIDSERNHGFRVPPLTRRDLRDIVLVRLALETSALQRAIECGDDEWERGVVNAMDEYCRHSASCLKSNEAMRRWERAHDALHRAMIKACGSPRTIKLHDRLQEETRRYGRLVDLSESQIKTDVEDHKNLVSLVIDRRLSESIEEFRRHVMVLLHVLEKEPVWEVAALQKQ